MPFGQTQEELDNYRRFDASIEAKFSDRVALGRLNAEITGATALDPTDRQGLLGRVNQYLVDMDKRDAMDRGEDLIPDADA